MPVTTQDAEDYMYAWDLTAQAQSIELWRKEVGVAVGDLGGDRDAVSVARLGVSELISNVLKHVASRRCRLVVVRDELRVVVRVRDGSRQAPCVTAADVDSEGGRGLWLLREMAQDVGWSTAPGGKWVWFAVPVSVPGSGSGAA